MRISKELRHRRHQLFTFVVEPGVPWHNNDAETQIRQGVLFRKISGGRRSWTGAWVLERLLTVYRTCRKRGIEFLDVVGSALQGNGYPGFGAASGAPESRVLTLGAKSRQSTASRELLSLRLERWEQRRPIKGVKTIAHLTCQTPRRLR